MAVNSPKFSAPAAGQKGATRRLGHLHYPTLHHHPRQSQTEGWLPGAIVRDHLNQERRERREQHADL